MLAPEELADLRSVASDALPGRCDVLRNTRVRQPNGSWRSVSQTVYADVPCRKVPSGQTPQELAIMQGTQGARAIAIFQLEAPHDLYNQDKIRYMGRDYEVAGIQDRTDEMYVTAVVYDDEKAPVT